jgi:hypothetical protein
VRLVLLKLREAGLKIKWSKCEWAVQEVKYLGFVIKDGKVRPSSEKVKALFHYEKPRTRKQLHRFVGLANYYRNYIEDFASKVHPLIEQLNKKVKFTWSQECESSFDYLRSYLTTEKAQGRGIMLLPDMTKTFRIECDACNYGIGSVLTQQEDGAWLPIGYFSKYLNKTERKYATNEKELMALVMSMKHWRVYLLGKRFIAFTDHKPLQWIMIMQNPPAKLARWLLTIGDYDFELQFRKGSENANADAISRWLATDDDDRESNTCNTDRIVNAISIGEELTREESQVTINAIYLAAYEFNLGQDKDESIYKLKRWIIDGERPAKKPVDDNEAGIFWLHFH